MTFYPLACLALFLVTYLINSTMISVFYHRGLAHDAVQLGPRMRRLVATAGIWLTGLDPKAWVCMHRAHHKHSDQAGDPHSPKNAGLFGVLVAQLRSYERTLIGLARGESQYTALVRDLDFQVNALNRRGLWLLPYLAHLVVALAIALPSGFWLLGACYWLGMMSHPVQGWIVNSLGHASGRRNFATNDNSRNNHLAAWLIVGEGFQNNHHAFPASAKFSYRRREIDLGWSLCRLFETLGLLTINRASLIPSSGLAPAKLIEKTARGQVGIR